MHQNGNVYEYIGIYIDDLAMVLHEPQEFVEMLTNKYGFKLKGTGPITFHLGCDFHCDQHGVLCMEPCKYILKMVSTYECLFGQKLSRRVLSPLDPKDHPELDTSKFLDLTGTQQYQSLVGVFQWAVSWLY
jgi:hypothetical protein